MSGRTDNSSFFVVRSNRLLSASQPPQRAAHARVLKIAEEGHQLRIEDAAAPLHQLREGWLGRIGGVA